MLGLNRKLFEKKISYGVPTKLLAGLENEAEPKSAKNKNRQSFIIQ